MKTDKQLKALAEPIVEVYNQIAHDLLLQIASFFKVDNNVKIKNSLDWYFTKLEELGALNSESLRIIAKYSDVSESKIKKALKESGFGSVDETRLNKLADHHLISIKWNELLKAKSVNHAINNSFTEVKDVFKMINTRAIESTKKMYMDALNQARLGITTGIYDQNTAIKRAVEKMVDDGIKGATYKRKDGTVYQMSLESVVRRDMITAIYQTFNNGSEAVSKELGAEYYEVSSHLGARLGDGKNPISNHFGWQGKIYKINGSTDEYDNFYEQTGYGDILGLGGVNCRHKFWAFFPKVDKPSQHEYSYEENKKAVDLQNKQRAMEKNLRNIRTKQEAFKLIGDDDSVKEWKQKEKNYLPQYIKFIKNNNLNRNYAREKVISRK